MVARLQTASERPNVFALWLAVRVGVHPALAGASPLQLVWGSRASLAKVPEDLSAPACQALMESVDGCTMCILILKTLGGKPPAVTGVRRDCGVVSSSCGLHDKLSQAIYGSGCLADQPVGNLEGKTGSLEGIA